VLIVVVLVLNASFILDLSSARGSGVIARYIVVIVVPSNSKVTIVD